LLRLEQQIVAAGGSIPMMEWNWVSKWVDM
jgi:hypothetical protein